jgi:hypothetical protein
MQQPEVSKLLKSAKVVYSAGFFITACAPAVEACADHCLAHKKTYALVRRCTGYMQAMMSGLTPQGVQQGRAVVLGVDAAFRFS